MIISMFLSHLIGDYVLQWDKLAEMKSNSLRGILLHGAVVTAVTFAFVLAFDPIWWQGALFISGMHIFIDAIQLPITKRPSGNGAFALTRFLADQIAHGAVIFSALVWGGYWEPGALWVGLLAEIEAYPTLVYVFSYTCLAMPAWILLEFILYGLMRGTPPNFAEATNKYVSSIERWLIMTCVLLGQFLLVPLVAAPRFWMERGRVTNAGTADANLYTAKLLASVGLAVALGLGLRHLLLLP